MESQNATLLNHNNINVHETIMADGKEQVSGMEIQIYVQPPNPCPATKFEDSDSKRLKSIKEKLRSTIKVM